MGVTSAVVLQQEDIGLKREDVKREEDDPHHVSRLHVFHSFVQAGTM
jgi:hypothetical protein